MTNPKFHLFAVALMATALLIAPSPARAALGDCGQPKSTGAVPTASDALEVLKTAVGSANCGGFDPCICDVNSSISPSVTASDALLVLQKAVGQNVTLMCPCNITTTTSTTSTTMPVPGGPKCSSAELISLPGSVLDSGWTGAGHDSALIDGAKITLRTLKRCSGNDAVCSKTSDCPSGQTCDLTCDCDDPANSVCEITGPTHQRRCLVSLGTCSSNADCSGSAGGNCVRFFGPPLPLVASGTPVCVTTYFASNITGTADTKTGEGVASVALRSRVHTTDLTNPCPRCSVSGAVTIGKTGTCVGATDRVNMPCTVEAVSPDFGGMSSDCPPKSTSNVTGVGLSVKFREVTTGTVARTARLVCSEFPFNPNGAGGFCMDTFGTTNQVCTSNADCLRCTDDLSICTGNGDCTGGGTCAAAPDQPIACGVYCHCGFCNDNPDEPCFDDSECPSGQSCVVGTGGSQAQNQPQRRANNCDISQNICDDDGRCLDKENDTLGQCSLKSYLTCTTDSQCSSQGGGTCVFEPRPCFPNKITRTGVPSPLGKYCSGESAPTSCNTNADCSVGTCEADTSAPNTVAAFCIPGTAASAVNNAGGLTGPGAITFKSLIRVCRCGDSSVGCDEQCDDGNSVSGDGCDENCQCEPGSSVPGCP